MSKEAAFANDISTISSSFITPGASSKLVTQSTVGELDTESSASGSFLALGSSIGLASRSSGLVLTPHAAWFVHTRATEFVIYALWARVADESAASAVLVHAKSLALTPCAT